MLSYPTYALLKQSLPECRVYALVPSYTREMAEACPWIDEILIDEWQGRGIFANRALFSLFKQHQFDAIISLYSTTRVGLFSWLAAIPYRLAPATKLAQIFYNHTIRQKRSLSKKPEYEYNLDLIRYFLTQINQTSKNISSPYLQFSVGEVSQLRSQFEASHQIPPGQKLVFIHPGSGGSARNLNTQQYARLAVKLTSTSGHIIVISAGPGEYENAHSLAKCLPGTAHIIYESREGLRNFAQHIQFADLFIGGSTGPVHVAGALDVPTVAFYPRRRSATSVRWQTLNSTDKRLTFSPPDDAQEEDMSSINIDAVANTISKYYLL